MKAQFSTSAVRRAETDRVANGRLSDFQMSSIAAVEVAVEAEERQTPLLDRALAWWKKQDTWPTVAGLQAQFHLHPDLENACLYEAEEVEAAIARHFELKRASARCNQLRDRLIRPHFAAQAKCDPLAFLIWEEEYLSYASRNGIDNSRMGYDSAGHWGPNAAAIEKLWYISGCRDSPKYRWLIKYEMRRDPGRDVKSYHFIKKSYSLQECKDILRGANWLQREGLHWGPYSFGAVQLRTIGRVSVPMRHALLHATQSIYIKENGRISVRTKEGAKLNYMYAAQVQGWDKERQATILPPKSAHFFLGGNAEGWIKKQEAERIALASTDVKDVISECRRIIEAGSGIIPVPCTHAIRVGESVKVGCTWITVKHAREAELDGETLGIALAILKAYEGLQTLSECK